MNPRRRLLVSALAAPAVVGGCKVRTINYFPPTNATVRFVNVMLDAGPLDTWESGVVVWPATPFQGTTGYVEFENNTRTFSINQAGSATQLTSIALALAGKQPYTLTAFATLAQPFLILVADVNIANTSGTTLSRFTNVVYGSQNLDIYVTLPDVDITTVSPSFSSSQTATSTSALQLAAGTLRVRITLAGSPVPVYDSGPLDFTAQANNTLILYTLNSAFLPQMILLETGGPNRQTVVPNTLSSLRLVNGAFQTGAVDVLFDGTSVADDVAYATAAPTNFVAAGAHALVFEASATPGAPVATLARTFPSAQDSSVLLVGFAGALQAIAFDDDNRVPIEGQARVRFVNGSSDDATYDVFIGDVRAVQALAPRTASVYLSLEGTTVTVTFRNPATGAIALTVADVALPSGTVNTIYAVGIAADLDSIVVASR